MPFLDPYCDDIGFPEPPRDYYTREFEMDDLDAIDNLNAHLDEARMRASELAPPDFDELLYMEAYEDYDTIDWEEESYQWSMGMISMMRSDADEIEEKFSRKELKRRADHAAQGMYLTKAEMAYEDLCFDRAIKRGKNPKPVVYRNDRSRKGFRDRKLNDQAHLRRIKQAVRSFREGALHQPDPFANEMYAAKFSHTAESSPNVLIHDPDEEYLEMSVTNPDAFWTNAHIIFAMK